jgi:hypothetical protein
MGAPDLKFIENPSVKGREDRYKIVRVRVDAVLKSWRTSLFSFEWLNPDGSIRTLDELPMHERDKRIKAEQSLSSSGKLERPVLGVGIMDNIEIGAGRDVFLTLAAKGQKDIEVHIPISNVKDFKQFLSV